MAFSDKSFTQRFAQMGDLAESNFEAYAQHHSIDVVRWGLNRPPLRAFYKIPFKIRMAPDYLCQAPSRTFFVECKGTNGTTLKLKKESLDGLSLWDEECPVWIFIYDSKNHRSSFVSLELLKTICVDTPVKLFDDGKAYHAIPCAELSWDAMPTPKE